MLKRYLNGKIRDIRITAARIDYEGSITLDEEYMEKAGIEPNEEVQVLNIANGERFTTYAIKAKRGSGAVQLNGPAARLGLVGDPVMVLSYIFLTPEEAANHTPKIVRVTPEIH
jgi:aspartate 1-decarboxylase